MKKVFLFIILAIIFTACQKPETPIFKRIDNKKIDAITKDSVTISGKAVYYNQNKMGLKVMKSDINVYLRDNYIGKVLQDNIVEVKPKMEFNIPFKVKLSLSDLAKKGVVSDLFLMMNKAEIPIHYKGTTTVKIIGIKINIPIDYSDKMVF